MPSELFVKGLLIGFAIAAPVGPIGVLCIRRTLASGRTIGLLTGLGAATADMSYGAVAAFGLTAVQQQLVQQQFWLHTVGGVFLLYLGVRTFFAAAASAPSAGSASAERLSAYVSTFGLTLTNPATILSFALVFSGLRLAEAGGGYGGAAVLVGGVFVGSAAWWLTLSNLVGALRERFSPRWLSWINRLAGALIFAFGIAALLS